MKTQTGMILLEILLSVLVLSVGLIAVYRPLLASLSALDYADTRLEARHFIADRIWECQRAILEKKRLPTMVQKQPVVLNKRQAYYQVKIMPLSPDNHLLRLNHVVWWRAGGRIKNVKQFTYVNLPYEKNS
ncbi:MAG: hypothetical protein NC930_00025 [Candidatus Omnitrophica bacterium]|nr:hypothetical protein [Candidatus Omnitrophota bacterium]